MATPERKEKLTAAARLRFQDLTVVLEDIHDPHNISAILRTCDAVGIAQIHVISDKGASQRMGKKSSASARKWVARRYWDNISSCLNVLRDGGYTIYTTHLGEEAKSLYDVQFNGPTAIVVGNEHRGVSEDGLKLSHHNLVIPMRGILPSLNVSVATAVTLFEIVRQRGKTEEGGFIGTAQHSDWHNSLLATYLGKSNKEIS